MYLIDSHAHIYLPEFDDNRESFINQASVAGVQKIFMPAIDSSTHEKMLEVERSFPSCLSMMGLHPCSVKENSDKELNVVEQYLKKKKFIAIGEIGLDFYWDVSYKDQQYQAFHRQIQWALEYDLPIVIHSRNAVDECIEVVSSYPELRGVFHCFSGNAEQARKIIELNFMLGIGGVVTFKNAGLDKVLQEIGITNIILETDAPYLAPVPYRGKRNEPSYLKLIAEKLVAITGMSIELIAELTTANANKLFKQSQQA
jgi:TatD DNase family protein